MSNSTPHTLDDLLAGEQYSVRRTVEILSQIFGAATVRTGPPTVLERLTAHVGAPREEWTTNTVRLGPSTVLATGLVLTDLIDQFAPVVGPDSDDDPPHWSDHRLGSVDYCFPSYATLFFDVGLAPIPVAIQIGMAVGYSGSWLSVIGPPGAREELRAVVAEIRRRTRARNPLRGKVLRAAVNGGIALSVVEDLDAERAQVMVPGHVWDEIDLAKGAVTTRHELLSAAGLPTSRGVMLAGPPGVGKTAVVRVIAAEMVGEFTVVIADASVASYGLTALYDLAEDLGPMVVILDDIDLYVRRRGDGNDNALGALLAALDGAAKQDRVLTIATTNDPRALDGAATRAARFDSIIELGPPSDAAAAAMLRTHLAALPDARVEVDRVVAALPSDRSGADIAEVVRRAILVDGGDLTTATMLSVVGAHDYEASLPVGAYL